MLIKNISLNLECLLRVYVSKILFTEKYDRDDSNTKLTQAARDPEHLS